ncbi:MAG: acyl-CoA dehydratase activase [Deferrisomatales bacterium]|nr:acyl-CoA dehydratase activase [Deferrisomatales bacterium]
MSNPFFLGIDLGSSWSKAVLLDADGQVRARVLRRTGISFEDVAAELRQEALDTDGAPGDRLAFTVTTGYGRRNVAFADARRTEISCHAAGAFHHFPREMDVVDIGGQDNKIIHVRRDGAVSNFLMNRKCAAGTGAFVEEVAHRLDLPLERIEAYAEAATKDITLSSFCTVFSATEVIKLIREGEGPENLCRGIFNSVVARVAEMGPLGSFIVMSGGVVGAFPIVAQLMAARTGAQVEVPPHPQFLGAFGAALVAREEAHRP